MGGGVASITYTPDKQKPISKHVLLRILKIIFNKRKGNTI